MLSTGQRTKQGVIARHVLTFNVNIVAIQNVLMETSWPARGFKTGSDDMMTLLLSIIVLISSSVFLILLLCKEPKKEKNYTLYALASMNANIWRKDKK